ncbi:diaminopimelate epimerase [Carbonactinospora thermoautotrophica]|uniref:diaminopimelate epimerase n=1 Tax=Carbonactinospora thermoautotrophica TaxID=1469144 RepID=UPI0022708FC0|nr:diaminopimelate epimerase [Carbonactinospora thermoautotrophica]MCX9191240.1 diaminopimelate epimerase [Carbonactinospora thermoautotrophica]
MTALRFVKGHGTENDFVVVPDPDGLLDLAPGLVAAICDRRAGLGADGLLRVVRCAADPEAKPWADEATWFMDYRNADGGVAEMCGNGVRVFARYLVESGLEQPGELRVATRGGVKTVRFEANGDVTVDMGPAAFPGPDGAEVRAGGHTWPAVSVSMGNPHAVVFVADLAQPGDLRQPPEVRPTFPHGVNVEFVVERGPRRIAMRVHERGVGETRSCGTGACAAMVVAARRHGASVPVTYDVEVPGGRLRITERSDGHVELSGPAVLLASGELDPRWVAAHR